MNRVDAEASRRVIMLDTGEDETLDRLLETLKAVQEEGSPDKEKAAAGRQYGLHALWMDQGSDLDS